MKFTRFQKAKKAFTLLEIMIVICIIGMISGVIGFNMVGSLDRSRAYKTETVMRRVKDLLDLEVAMSDNPQEVAFRYKAIVASSGLFKNPEEFCKDGWGNDLVVEPNPDTKEVMIKSAAYDSYCLKTGKQPVAL